MPSDELGSAEQQEMLDVIERQVQAMKQITDDLLDMTRR